MTELFLEGQALLAQARRERRGRFPHPAPGPSGDGGGGLCRLRDLPPWGPMAVVSLLPPAPSRAGRAAPAVARQQPGLGPALSQPVEPTKASTALSQTLSSTDVSSSARAKTNMSRRARPARPVSAAVRCSLVTGKSAVTGPHVGCRPGPGTLTAAHSCPGTLRAPLMDRNNPAPVFDLLSLSHRLDSFPESCDQRVAELGLEPQLCLLRAGWPLSRDDFPIQRPF